VCDAAFTWLAADALCCGFKTMDNPFSHLQKPKTTFFT
jgi:hypothetical protein